MRKRLSHVFARLGQRRARARQPRRGSVLEDIWRDVTSAARHLARAPGVTVPVIASLALVIGASTAIFSVVDAVLLRPLPYPEPNRLVRIDGVFTTLPLRVTEAGITLAYPPVAPELREARSLVAVGAFVVGRVNVGRANPERMTAAAVSRGFFASLGVAALVGRTLDDAGAGKRDRVAVLSQRYWTRRFQSDVDVVGRNIVVNEHPFQVVGVMPARVDVPDAVDIWIPESADPQLASQVTAPAFIGRLAPSATAASTRDEVLALLQGGDVLTRQAPGASALAVSPLRDSLVREARPLLLFMSAAALLALCGAGFNTAGLLVTRMSAREREFAVRRANGASTARLVRQVCTETVLLAGIAGLTAIPLSRVWLAGISHFIPPSLHGAAEIDINFRALVVLAVLALLVGALVGLASAACARRRWASSLRVSSSSMRDAGWRRFTGMLVTLEVALAVAILIPATGLVSTVEARLAVDIGPTNDGAVVAEITLPQASYAVSDQRHSFWWGLRQQLAATSGVRTVGATMHLPGTSTLTHTLPMIVEGQALPSDTPVGNALRLLATPGYFATLGIELLAGRGFDETDRADTPPKALVSQQFVQAVGLEPGDMLGRRVSVGVGQTRWAEVVGVVHDVRMRGPDSDLEPAVYLPFAQAEVDLTGYLVVDAAMEAGAAAATIRAALAGVDPHLPLGSIRTFGDVRSDYVSAQRLAMTATVAFAGISSGLAALGQYALLSYLVRLRIREFGVRVALGATSSLLQREVVVTGLRHACAGIGLGIVGGLGLWRLAAVHIPGLLQVDATRVLAVSGVVLVVSLTAAWLPARRAASADPLAALRCD